MTKAIAEDAEARRILLTQRQAAALVQVSPSYLRASDCPKILLVSGSGKRPIIRYTEQDLHNWAAGRRVPRTGAP